MTNLHFSAPEWAHLLWVVLAFVVLLVWLERRGNDALDRFVSTVMQPRLLSRPSTLQRATRITFLGISCTLLTLALMRPQWGLEVTENRRAGAEIMICLDVSRSMLAEDVAPNRLDRAKAEIRDLLHWLDGDQVGLIAFAGRATVLSPLTPDFGFLHLALDDANPGSVTRGGTRLEEPITKAVDGFGDTDDVSRSILLITDGEDHDSFPMQAAELAAQRGIRILAIGFGAEEGSGVPITDPDTGARVLLRDTDGRVVHSRLDGELLREMALTTNGAYIPAGTGVLDLESIYRRHIAPLTRGRLETQLRTVRNEAFQWAVLLGLLALIAAVMSMARTGGHKHHVLVMALTTGLPVLSLSTALDVHAARVTEIEAPLVEKHEPDAIPEPDDVDTDLPVPEDPRAAYNEGLAKLKAGDTEAASRYLTTAREKASADGEVRFRATYNLGWAEVTAADALIKTEPTKALERLQRAAAWFREALDLRPGHDDARYNLEIVMRRTLELTDSLAETDKKELKEAIDALIKDQRAFLGRLRDGLSAQQANDTANVTPELRRQFRSLAARELTVLGESEKITEGAVQELETLNAKPEAERSTENALRASQLEAVVRHLHHARERIGQARSRLRRTQGERAYRRAANALGAFQRARDQLLDPVARLDALLTDGMEITQLTSIKASFERAINTSKAPAKALDWLTPEYLVEEQEHLYLRTGELHLGLKAGLEAYHSNTDLEDNKKNEQQAAAQAKLVEQLQTATPLIGSARENFETAANAIRGNQLNAALDAQRLALEDLVLAREHFLDVRGLVELVYANEQEVAALISDGTPSLETDLAEHLPTSLSDIQSSAYLQQRNIERSKRLDKLITDAMVESFEMEPAPVEPTAAQPDDGKRAFFDRAHELVRGAQDAMHSASETFSKVRATESGEAMSTKTLQATRLSVDTALEYLEQLRRMFFSVVEHLRETTSRQQALGDDTETVAVLSDPKTPIEKVTKAGPLRHRQKQIATTTQKISNALREQAETQPPQRTPTAGAAPGLDPERMNKAAELVSKAGKSMTRAADQLDDAHAFDAARDSQNEALLALETAIELLQDGQDEPQSGQKESQPEHGGNVGEQEQEAAQGQQNVAQLLQGVRDREARRRGEQARDRTSAAYEPVEKDW